MAASKKTVAPYGEWSSPISTDLVLSSAITLGEAKVSPSRSAVAWIESRPEQKGRAAIVYQSLSGKGGKQEEVIPDTKYNARSRVHEYGGGSWAFAGEDEIIFSSFEGAAYTVKRGSDGSWSEPKQATPTSDVYRYADFETHPSSPTVACILEDHTNPEPAHVQNSLVLITPATQELVTVASGHDFYSSPRWSPSGRYLAYIRWNHPAMPWQGSELCVIAVTIGNDGKLALQKETLQVVAGKLGYAQSVSQPRWALAKEGAPERVVFLDDSTGFYELYKYEPEGTKKAEPLLAEPTNLDGGSPDWQFGQRTHTPLSADLWLSKAPEGSLRITKLSDGTSKVVKTPYVSVSNLNAVDDSHVLVIGNPARAPNRIALLSLPSEDEDAATEEVLKISSTASVDEAFLPIGKSITYPSPTEDCPAYAVYYEPASGSHTGPEGTLPPLIVNCHGGPTSAAGRGLNWNYSFFTSRGFALVDVDYGGSSNYGKKFRERLDGEWGNVDVNDTIHCVEYLVREGKVDGNKVAITGGSAGGFTVLAALCDSKVFTAGVSLYGVSDLALLAADTHKFESQYLYRLVGGTPEEVPDNYRNRSPINKAGNVTAPLLLLQGDIDKVVPPAQSSDMLEKIRANGGVCEMKLYENEGHGFRGRVAQEDCLKRSLGWYRKTWGLKASAEDQ
ncbi:hypothetical protein JCM10908_002503 [Rhodotorula pacifica]|uniref:uncharacterized protein n=1 Tax=Rhodotorula pacifica TaxID=1495444 RepID=UPI0031706FA2